MRKARVTLVVDDEGNPRLTAVCPRCSRTIVAVVRKCNGPNIVQICVCNNAILAVSTQESENILHGRVANLLACPGVTTVVLGSTAKAKKNPNLELPWALGFVPTRKVLQAVARG